MKKFKTTDDIKIPDHLVDQVIGQERAVGIIKKAAKQHRNVLLIGQPGTGKTLLAQAIAELLPIAELEDVLVYKNPNDENRPLVKTVKTYPQLEKGKETSKPLGDGQGRQIVQREKLKNRLDYGKTKSNIAPAITVIVIILVIIAFTSLVHGYQIVLIGALILGVLIFGSAALFVGSIRRTGILPGMFDTNEPKLIVDNTGMTNAPFVDGTGSRAGALFGDVRHDPLQCIPTGEKVLLPNGNLISIEKLVDPYFTDKEEGEVELHDSGFSVLGGFDSKFNLSQSQVVRVYKRKYFGKIINIKTRSGGAIKVTPNHPIATLDSKGKVEYVEAGLIKNDLRVVMPEKIHRIESREIDDALIIFIADVLADGYLGNRHVEFNLKRDFKIDQIKKNIERLGYMPKIRTRYDGATHIQVNSAALCKMLHGIGLKEGKLKKVPDIIFGQSESKIILFLSRLLSLDGYINKQGQFEIISASRLQMQQVRSLLFTLGINAKYKTRIDTGYGKEKGTIQHMLRWNHFGFANSYKFNTINPIHQINLAVYLESTTFNKEPYDDIVPLNFDALDGIRTRLNVSKGKIYRDYWSVNPKINGNTNLTRNFLTKINNRFVELGAVGEDMFLINSLAKGDYAFDEILEIHEQDYNGFVYNMTTESGNYLVDFVLTHNSGGLGTPPHLRVEGGAVHRASKGVLFIDEVANLEPRSQQDLLTAMQEKKYVITGQSELSSGAMVRTDPAPADFLLVAAGNLQDIQKMHPALRSRIRGYGYEVYMESSMPDTEKNREDIIRFIAQEVKKDGKIPPFDYSACMAVIDEAKRRSERKNRLTLILRELGGIVRAAGDMAVERDHKVVTEQDVNDAMGFSKPIEAQFVEQSLDYRKDYKIFKARGYAIGRVNGLAIIGSSYLSAGIVLPIVAEVTKASSRTEGKLIPTGKLGTIAREAVKNTGAIIKRHMNRDMASYDVHVQFIQTYEGVEGDSASISVAVAVISALEGIPVDEEVAMTGSLSVRGDVLPVGGVSNKVKAAIEAGMKYVIVPEANAADIYIDKKELRRIKVVSVKNIAEVLEVALKKSPRRDEMIKKLKSYMTGDAKERQPLQVD